MSVCQIIWDVFCKDHLKKHWPGNKKKWWFTVIAHNKYVEKYDMIKLYDYRLYFSIFFKSNFITFLYVYSHPHIYVKCCCLRSVRQLHSSVQFTAIIMSSKFQQSMTECQVNFVRIHSDIELIICITLSFDLLHVRETVQLGGFLAFSWIDGWNNRGRQFPSLIWETLRGAWQLHVNDESIILSRLNELNDLPLHTCLTGMNTWTGANSQ